MPNPSSKSSSLPGGLLLILSVIILFSVLCLNREETGKVLGLSLLFVTLFALFIPRLRQRLSFPLVGLFLVTLMGGISTFYAVSGKFALREFLYLLTAFSSALLLTLLPDRDGQRGRTMAQVLVATVSLVSLVSIDLISTRLISTPVLGLFSPLYSDVSGLEEGIRITSFLEAPNVFAGCTGIGVLLSLTLSLSADTPSRLRWSLGMLLVNSLAFLLAFSMGALAAILPAFLLFLLLEHKERRLKLFLIMAETLLISLLCVIPISATSLVFSAELRVIPLGCLCLGILLLLVTHRFVAQPLEKKLAGRRLWPLVLSCLLLILVFSLTAFLWTGDYSLSQGEALRRAIYPQPGDYTLSSESDGETQVTVHSQNRQDVMMHTEQELFSGSLSGAAFTVPEDSLVVWLTFSSQENVTLREVTCLGAETCAVPLGYPLLPGFIANRLQGLRANENAIQRLVFMVDGLRLFRQSPLVGLGLGAFECTLFSVQDFYYETKYVHNHYIQTLLETGILGLGLFLGLFFLSVRSLFRRRKTGHPFLPGLGALLCFMALHAGVEVVFSSGFYLPLAFGVFALTGMDAPIPSKALRSWSLAPIGAFLAVFGVLLSLNLYAQKVGTEATVMDDLKKAEALDPFGWTDYALSYVAHAPGQNDPAVLSQAEEYLEILNEERSNSIHYHLARYCFETGQPGRAMEMLHRQMALTPSSSPWWNTVYALIYEFDDGSEIFREGIASLYAAQTQWEETHLGSILLEDVVLDYVNHSLLP